MRKTILSATITPVPGVKYTSAPYIRVQVKAKGATWTRHVLNRSEAVAFIKVLL